MLIKKSLIYLGIIFFAPIISSKSVYAENAKAKLMFGWVSNQSSTDSNNNQLFQELFKQSFEKYGLLLEFVDVPLSRIDWALKNKMIDVIPVSPQFKLNKHHFSETKIYTVVNYFILTIAEEKESLVMCTLRNENHSDFSFQLPPDRDIQKVPVNDRKACLQLLGIRRVNSILLHEFELNEVKKDSAIEALKFKLISAGKFSYSLGLRHGLSEELKKQISDKVVPELSATFSKIKGGSK